MSYTALPFNPNPLQGSIQSFFRRNSLLIMIVGLFVTFWMLVYSLVIFKPQFAANSVVIIKDSAITSRYIGPEQYYAQQTTTASSSNPVLNTMEILKSSDISDALWEFFNDRYPKELDMAKIKSFRDWDRFYQNGSNFIKAKHQSGTDLINIQFSWTNPEVARDALAVVLTTFQKSSRLLNQQEQSNRTLFLKRQVLDLEGKLEAIREEKSSFQQEQGSVDTHKEGTLLAATRTEMENKLNLLQSQAEGKEEEVNRYESMLGVSSEKALTAVAVGQNKTMSKLQDKLYQLEETAAQMKTSLTEENPKLQEVESQISQVRTSLSQEKQRTLGNAAASVDMPRIEPDKKAVVTNEDNTPTFTDSSRGKLVDAMLASQAASRDLRTQATVIRHRLSEVQSEIQQFPEVAKDLTRLQQKEAHLSYALDQVRQKLLEGELKEEDTLSNVFIMDRPHVPLKAKFPSQIHMVIISLLMGAGAGIASGLLKDQLGKNNRNAPPPDWLEPLSPEGHEQEYVARSYDSTNLLYRQEQGQTVDNYDAAETENTNPQSQTVSLPSFLTHQSQPDRFSLMALCKRFVGNWFGTRQSQSIELRIAADDLKTQNRPRTLSSAVLPN